jgi:aryl-alcohol dehydrogenase-like predicted oxidoreductase
MLTGNRTRTGELTTTRAGSDPLSGSQYDAGADFDIVDRVSELAAGRGVPPAQIALAWLLHKPAVTAPIVGATKLMHVEDALAATRLALSEEEIQRLEEPYIPHRVLGHS